MARIPRAQHLLIVSGGRDLHDRARDAQPGLRTTVICRPEVVPRLSSPDRIERLIVLRADAPVAEWVAAARFVHNIDPIDRIANFTEKDTDKTAAIGEELQLEWHSPATVHAVADKHEMRRVLVEAGLSHTMAATVTDVQDVLSVADDLGYPLICKPARGVASKGVTRIDGPNDIPSALARGADATADLDSPDLLIEPFLTGDEYSVECVSEDGEHLLVGITHKISEPVNFVEIGHIVPAPLRTDDEQRIATAVLATLRALGIRHGVTHTEVITTRDTVHIVETHLRLAGDEIPELWALVSDVDMIDVAARQAVGMKVLGDVRSALDTPHRGARSAAIWYACPEAVGDVLEVSGTEKARALEGVVDVKVLRGPGMKLKPVTGSFARSAHACAVGLSHDEALRRAREAVRMLTFTIRSDAMPPQHASLHP